MKYIIGLLATLLPILSGAQSPPIKALTIGDTVPDITITNVYNYPASTIHLSDLKGKLVILDFWSTWCGACIEAFPKMEKLQKEFGDQLQVILVNTFEGDTIKRVQSFFDKRQQRTGQAVELPYSLLQSSLPEYFPYKFIPHYVWIDKAGKVIATTTQNEVNKINIQKAIAGDLSVWHQKQDNLLFNKDKPLFIDGNGGPGNVFLYRTIVTPYIEGLGNASGIQRDQNGGIIRFYMLNNSLSFLLRNAYPDELNMETNRIIVEGTQPENLFKPANKNLELYNNLFCYDIAIPPSSAKDLQNIIRQDLQRYFNVSVGTTYKTEKCLVLRSGGTITRLLTKGHKPDMDIAQTSIRKFIQNQPVKVLVDFISNLPQLKSFPVIDELNLAEKIDITLPSNIYELNRSQLIEFLRKAGIDVSEQSRKIKFSIITNNGAQPVT